MKVVSHFVIQDHTLNYLDNGDGTHTAICTVCGARLIEEHVFVDHICACGAADSELEEITSVQVNVQKQTTRVRFLFFFHRTKTTYEATVNVVGANVGVSKVEYRLENGIFWKNGDEFSSSKEIGPFDIRVRDSNGAVTYWYYNGSTTVKLA